MHRSSPWAKVYQKALTLSIRIDNPIPAIARCTGGSGWSIRLPQTLPLLRKDAFLFAASPQILPQGVETSALAFYLKVSAYCAGADGNMVPRMRPARGIHPCLTVVTYPVPARMSLRRIRGTRMHGNTFMFRGDQGVTVVRWND